MNVADFVHDFVVNALALYGVYCLGRHFGKKLTKALDDK